MDANTSGQSAPQKSTPQRLFCCSSVPLVRKSNIPPNHPLHQLLQHLSTQEVDADDNDAAPKGDEDTHAFSSQPPSAPQPIPGAGECAIIIISDPAILSDPSSSSSTEIKFDPSRATSRMFWGHLSTSAAAPAAPSPPLQAWNNLWTWREKIDARNNVGGILREVDGDMQGRLRKEMTGYECPDHRWKFTFVVLIGVGEQERLVNIMAAAGAADGAKEGAPACAPQ